MLELVCVLLSSAIDKVPAVPNGSTQDFIQFKTAKELESRKRQLSAEVTSLRIRIVSFIPSGKSVLFGAVPEVHLASMV